jgi:peptidoglycan/xylan/chitin deacetylase (PgdA/CDA1 family)
MRRRIGVFVAACLYYSGLVKCTRRWTQRWGPRLIILNYHRASGGDLRSHLLYLRRHYRILHLEEALKELYARPQEGKYRRDRRTLLVLTFDDGYRDNYLHAFALARELQVPVTIFLIPGYIESHEPFWWREGERLARNARVDEVTIEGHTYHPLLPGQQCILAHIIDTRARQARSVAERETFLAETREALGVSSCAGEEEGALPLTWEQVREMEHSGWVSFGAHTMHHPILANLSDPAEVRREVTECREVLEQHLGHPILTFAYPVGRPAHFGADGLRSVRDAGYEWALTTIDGTNTSRSDPHQLRRVKTEVGRHWLVLAAEVSGIWRFFSHLWKNRLTGWMERG